MIDVIKSLDLSNWVLIGYIFLTLSALFILWAVKTTRGKEDD